MFFKDKIKKVHFSENLKLIFLRNVQKNKEQNINKLKIFYLKFYLDNTVYYLFLCR